MSNGAGPSKLRIVIPTVAKMVKKTNLQMWIRHSVFWEEKENKKKKISPHDHDLLECSACYKVPQSIQGGGGHNLRYLHHHFYLTRVLSISYLLSYLILTWNHHFYIQFFSISCTIMAKIWDTCIVIFMCKAFLYLISYLILTLNHHFYVQLLSIYLTSLTDSKTPKRSVVVIIISMYIIRRKSHRFKYTKEECGGDHPGEKFPD